jgi:hypothetical protein
VTLTVTESPVLRGVSYTNFINAIRSDATKKGYNGALRRYMNHLRLKEVDDRCGTINRITLEQGELRKQV